jgi:hypothetical protein
MKTVIRLVVVAAMVLGAGVAWDGVRADDAQEEVKEPATQLEAAATPEPSREVFEPGAGGLEPEQSIDEAPGTLAHDEWVRSIWSSP